MHIASDPAISLLELYPRGTLTMQEKTVIEVTHYTAWFMRTKSRKQ
jgi:hypothetical protein